MIIGRCKTLPFIDAFDAVIAMSLDALTIPAALAISLPSRLLTSATLVHHAISPDHRLSHDYFANAEGTIEPEFLANNFEVKAEIWENGKLRDSFTKMHNQ